MIFRAVRRAPARITVSAAVILAAAVISLLVYSLGSPAVNTGPLGNGGTPGGICIPIAQGRVLSWGDTYLRNTGSADAVIQKVSLVKARNARLVTSYVVPITGYTEYGTWFGYPPTQPVPGVEWSQHARAVGAQLPPNRGLNHADLVLVIQPTGPVSQVQAISVVYQESGTAYQMLRHFRLVLLVGQKACSNKWTSQYPA